MSALGIRTILVGTDLEGALIPALRSAARLAELTDAQLHVVHTTEQAVPEARLDEHLRAAGIESNARVEGRILVGPPGALITEEAARLRADVIVLGPHRPQWTKLGSTAYRVVYGAQVPCLMLPVPLTLPLRNVLVPLDISQPARGPLAVGITWASALRHRDRNTGTRVTTLHVADVANQDTAVRLENEVDRVRRRFVESTGVTIDDVVEAGAPGEIILRRAVQDAVDLIVMATRGQQPRDAALGSVSLEVVMKSERPVLLVPPNVWRNNGENGVE
ncbi:MAG TPA: universal stress protein [Longimicrobiales bacterium]